MSKCLALSRERSFTVQLSKPTTGRGLALAEYSCLVIPHSCVLPYLPKFHSQSASNLHLPGVSSLISALRILQNT